MSKVINITSNHTAIYQCSAWADTINRDDSEPSDEAIKRFKQQYPHHTVDASPYLPQLSWKISRLVPVFVYQHHVRELLQRVVDQQLLEPITSAELLLILYQRCSNLEMGQDEFFLFCYLFDQVYCDTHLDEKYESVDISADVEAIGETMLGSYKEELMRFVAANDIGSFKRS